MSITDYGDSFSEVSYALLIIIATERYILFV